MNLRARVEAGVSDISDVSHIRIGSWRSRDGMDAGLGYSVGWESNGRSFDDYGSNCGSRNGMQVDNTLSAAPDKNKQCGSGLEEAAGLGVAVVWRWWMVEE